MKSRAQGTAIKFWTRKSEEMEETRGGEKIFKGKFKGKEKKREGERWYEVVQENSEIAEEENFIESVLD